MDAAEIKRANGRTDAASGLDVLAPAPRSDPKLPLQLKDMPSFRGQSFSSS